MLILITLIVFLFPLFFFPWITDSVFDGKNFFLAIAVLVVLVIAGIRLLKAKKLVYSIAPLDFLVFLFLLSNLVSWFFLPSGTKVRSLLQPLGLGTVIVLTLFYFSLSQLKSTGKRKKTLMALLISAAITSLFSVTLFVLPVSSTGFWANQLSRLALGSPVILAQLLVLMAALIIGLIVKEVKGKGELKKWWLALLGIIILVGAGTALYQTFKIKVVFLDWFSSWAIAVESFKRSPILGVGPGNFNTAFNLYRPIEFNRGENWNFRFGAPHSWFLQLWTETGLVGLIILLSLFFRTIRSAKKNETGRLLGLTWLALLLFPGNLITVFILFLSLALVRGKGKERSFSLVVGEKGEDSAPIIFGSLLIVFTMVSGYFLYRGFRSEFTFYQAIKAASENRGGDTYNFQLAAINQNRFLSRYRISFAQTNLALANSLANKGEDLTDDEHRQITQLLDQSVSEAKTAVALEPRNVIGWENLAQIYRQLVNVAEGADQWVVTTYQQAIALDSLNPRLRVDYGGLLYGMDQLDEAAKQFEIAVSLKVDFANAWYNWAWVLKQQEKLEDAVVKLQQAVNLVARDTPDYEKSIQELEEWKKELGQEAAASEKEEAPKELTQPGPLPTPQLEEPIQLPEEAAPPLEEMETLTPTPFDLEGEPIEPIESPESVD